MKTLRYLALPAAGALLLLVSGCGTTDTLESRIKSKFDVYAGLADEEQKQIKEGVITPGFSPDMVFMALGKPDQIIAQDQRGAEVWIYLKAYSPDGDQAPVNRKISVSMGTPTATVGGVGPTDWESKRDGLNPYYHLEYDATAENIKAQAVMEVQVKFTEGTVADIQVANNGDRVL